MWCPHGCLIHFMDVCIREKKAKVGNIDARLKIIGMGWAVVI